MKNTPIVIMPPMKTKMANQMIGPAQQRSRKKKIIERIMAATAAATKTSHPT